MYENACRPIRQQTTFAIVRESGIVKQVEKSTVLLPKTNYKGSGAKWFYDSRNLKETR